MNHGFHVLKRQNPLQFGNNTQLIEATFDNSADLSIKLQLWVKDYTKVSYLSVDISGQGAKMYRKLFG